MEYKRNLGLVLVVAGIFILIIQPFSPTGAVIDLSTSSAKGSFLASLIMIVAGMILMLVGKGGKREEKEG